MVSWDGNDVSLEPTSFSGGCFLLWLSESKIPFIVPECFRWFGVVFSKKFALSSLWWIILSKKNESTFIAVYLSNKNGGQSSIRMKRARKKNKKNIDSPVNRSGNWRDRMENAFHSMEQTDIWTKGLDL